ncbi:MAG: DNA recombination protein RmuC [Vampirovibrio sp.]|nr:DNA recombination protein RmuC [Vampirovibrio sp.]
MISFSEWFVSPFTLVLLISSVGLLIWLYQKQIKTAAQLSITAEQAKTATQMAENHWLALQAKTSEVQMLQGLGIEAKQCEAQLQELKPQWEQLQQTHQNLAIEKASLLAEKTGLVQQLAALKGQWEQQQTDWKTLWEAQLKNHLTDTLAQASKTLKLSAEQEEQQRLQGFKQLTAPIQTMLQEYQQHLKNMNKDHFDSVAVLKSQVELLHQSNHQLVSVLKTNKGAGDWGELQLLRILEFAGLQQGVHYDFQSAQTDRSRPDVVVKLPQNRFIIIDAKATQFSTEIREGTTNSITSIEIAAPNETEGTTETSPTPSLKDEALIKSIKTAVKDLASKVKNYTGYASQSPEFVVLFLPKESLLSQAMATDPLLWEQAWNQNVVISSPLTLIPLLRMVCMGWHQENITANVGEVQKLGRQVHDKLVLLAERLERVIKTHAKLEGDIDDLKTTFDGKQGLVSVVNKLEALEVGSAKKLPASFEDAPYLLGEPELTPEPTALPALSMASNTH